MSRLDRFLFLLALLTVLLGSAALYTHAEQAVRLAACQRTQSQQLAVYNGI